MRTSKLVSRALLLAIVAGVGCAPAAPTVPVVAAPGSDVPDGGTVAVTADGGPASPGEGGARDGAPSTPVVACATDKFSLSPARGASYSMDLNENGTHVEA